MTGAYLRVKREKWENIEVEYLTDEERQELLKDDDRLMQWLNVVCNKLAEIDMLPAYEDILGALEAMALQYLSDVDGDIMTHDFMIAGESCLDVLNRLGKVKSDDGVSYVFIDKEKGNVEI